MPAPFTRQTVTERALARLGTIVQQKYRIDRLLGIGGTAAVYSATHRNGHRVAIKFLLDHLLDDSDIYHLFSREAYVANRVGHPGAVPVLDDDEDTDGCVFLIMPLIEGETLRARWERSNKRMPIAEVGVFLADVLEVLDAAHAKGVVHRDIKPENLFVTLTAEIRVLDFGIARRTGGDTTLTMTGRFIGTPAFMPPEQALGNRQAIGPQSDLWAVGATMFSLLTGEAVHLAETSGGQLAAAATKRARSVNSVGPEVPLPIARVIDKALEFDVRDRWPSAQIMHDALLAAIEETLGEKADVIGARLRASIEADFDSKAGERAAAEAQTIADQEKEMRSGPARRTPKRGANLDAESDSGSNSGNRSGGNTDPTLAEGKEQQISDRRVRDAAAARDSGNEATLKPGSPLPKDRLAAREVSGERAQENDTPPVVRRKANTEALGALEATPEEEDDGTLEVPVARRRGFFARATPWMVVIGLAAVGGAFTMKRWGGGGPTSTTSAAPTALPSLNGEANAAFEAGLQLWKDASTEAAVEKFAEATRRDSGFALAHLYAAAASRLRTPDVLTHFAAARSLRGRLLPEQSGLLDALEPLMQDPPDNASTTSRLEALTTKFPNDSIAWMVRGSHYLRVTDAAGYLTVADHVPGALGHWFRGRAQELQDDLAGSRKSLQACVAAALQGGVDCLMWLARLEANEGHCEESAAAAKRMIAVDHASPDGYRFLARAEFGRTHRTNAVRAILEERWARLPEASRGVERTRDEVDLATIDGQFDRASELLDAGEKVASVSVDAHQRAVPYLHRIELEYELGHNDNAVRSGTAFIDASQTWLPEDSWDMGTQRTAVLYITGQINREEFRARRTKDEAALLARGGFFSAPSARWYEAYVENIKDAEDARNALEHQPADHPFIDPAFRDHSVDGQLGRMYMLVGQLDKAVAFLERASKSCLYTKALYHIYAHEWYGDALAKSDRPQEACEQYAYVLQRWGNEPRSRTVRETRESALRLGCPGVTGGQPRKTAK